jgi:hypothetical protein
MSGNHPLVSLGAFTQMLMIDTANIRPADGGSLDAQQNFAVPRGTGTVRISTLELPGKYAAFIVSFIVASPF